MKEDERSQTAKAVGTLREMILNGEIAAGERVAELVIAQRAGVSRTPARTALLKLAEEGLVEERPGGGLFVASFEEGDLYDAAEIRGVLEGTAARFAAERGVSQSVLGAMDRCLVELDRVIATDDEDLENYSKFNARFHQLLWDAAGSTMISRSLGHICKLPFAAPNAFSRATRQNVQSLRIISQDQHRGIVDAIRNRQGARAEALAREHSLSARKVAALALPTGVIESGAILKLIVGASVG